MLQRTYGWLTFVPPTNYIFWWLVFPLILPLKSWKLHKLLMLISSHNVWTLLVYMTTPSFLLLFILHGSQVFLSIMWSYKTVTLATTYYLLPRENNETGGDTKSSPWNLRISPKLFLDQVNAWINRKLVSAEVCQLLFLFIFILLSRENSTVATTNILNNLLWGLD